MKRLHLFFIFWTALLILLSYDYFYETDMPIEGSVLDVRYKASGRIVISNILVKTKNGLETFRLDPKSLKSIKKDHKILIRQSKIFRRTVSIAGPEYNHKTTLSFWNNLFFVFIMVSGIASFGSLYIYIRYLL